MTTQTNTQIIVAAVKEHALRYYNSRKLRWDMIVETKDDADLARDIEREEITSVSAAIKYFRNEVALYTEQYRSVRAEIF